MRGSLSIVFGDNPRLLVDLEARVKTQYSGIRIGIRWESVEIEPTGCLLNPPVECSELVALKGRSVPCLSERDDNTVFLYICELTRRQTSEGLEWRRTASGRTMTPYERGLRTITERTVSLRVRDSQPDELGELPLDAALRDVYPSTIYHHQGQTYEVQSLDLDRDVAWLVPTESDHQTRVQYDESMTIEEDIATKPLATREDVTVHSPHCGRANEPLDKRLAVTLTMALADPSRQVDNPKS